MTDKPKRLTQEQVWNAISKKWQTFRNQTPLEVQEFLKSKKGKILDLGCGSGRNFVKQNNLEIYGTDFSEKMLKFAKDNAKKKKISVKLIKSKCSELAFQDNFFDCAIFISTLHCIESSKERKKAILELFRVLKQGAEVMISVWDKEITSKLEYLKNTGVKEGYFNWKKDHIAYKRYYYFYDKAELIKDLKEVGFKIIKTQSKIENKHTKKNIIVYCKK